jgi:hypothetical protein
MYLYTYINAHVQHLIYWHGQCVCDTFECYVCLMTYEQMFLIYMQDLCGKQIQMHNMFYIQILL